MDSGIYRLTYRNGATYVGKSIHLTTRWKQHFDKLSKGKAAKEMQAAYHASGNQFPRTEVLVYCHPDMLDYYEGFFINDLKPPLNTAIPGELPEQSKVILVCHANEGMAKYSTIELIQALHSSVDEVVELKTQQADVREQLEQLEEDYEELSGAWDDRARRDNWARRDFQAVVESRDTWENSCKVLEAWRRRVEGATWWQRLWKTW